MHTLLLHYYLFILLFLLSRKKIESTIEVIVCTLTSIHSEDKKYISDPVQSQARIFIMCFALFCIVIEINTVISGNSNFFHLLRSNQGLNPMVGKFRAEINQ